MKIYRMNEIEARAAYRSLLETYCHDTPQPAEIAVPRLQALNLYDRERGGDVVVYERDVNFLERFSCSQDCLDAALYDNPEPLASPPHSFSFKALV